MLPNHQHFYPSMEIDLGENECFSSFRTAEIPQILEVQESYQVYSQLKINRSSTNLPFTV